MNAWDRYYEAEFSGPQPTLIQTMELIEMLEEGRHYLGVTLPPDQETYRL
jgi:hypothetical protein